MRHAAAGRVTVVGSINRDLVASVPSLPRPGQTVIATSLAQHHGGKGANQAVAAARAGASVTMFGAVGSDEAGPQAVEALALEGVDVRSVATLDGPTGTALIAVAPDGANQIIVSPGANGRLDTGALQSTLRAAIPAATDVLLVSLEVPLEAVAAAMAVAREASLTVVLNPAPARPLPPAVTRDVVLTPNRGELRTITGARTVATGAARLLGEGARAVVVTLGAAGCAVYDGGEALRLPGMAVEAVDTTGAGDCFNGVLAAALAGRASLREAARRANTAAGMSVTADGARGGMPFASAIDAAMSREA